MGATIPDMTHTLQISLPPMEEVLSKIRVRSALVYSLPLAHPELLYRVLCPTALCHPHLPLENRIGSQSFPQD